VNPRCCLVIVEARRWVVVAGRAGLAAGKRQVQAERAIWPGEHHCPGVERAPNPVASCVCGTWQSRWGPTRPVFVVGGLTVRKAEVPSGAGMTREANAGRRKATGNHDVEARLPLVVVDNRPDRDDCPGPKGR
jgi:hypothetical protein